MVMSTINFKHMILYVLSLGIFATVVPYLFATNYNSVNAQSAGTTFPPSIMGTVRNQPAYEVSIPFLTQNTSIFSPMEFSIPTGMTVIWFNDDDNSHSISTFANNTFKSPESFNSGVIPGSGGSFIHTFNTPGKYLYYDTQSANSGMGIINVGSNTIEGTNMNMIVGGTTSLPFSTNHTNSLILSFVPTTVQIPPTTAITYNVALLNADKKIIYSKNFDDVDGILDIELVPRHLNTTAFTDWGPDFIGQEQFRSDGVFHIKGPVLTEDHPYYIQVSMIAKDNMFLPNYLTDTFELTPRK